MRRRLVLSSAFLAAAAFAVVGWLAMTASSPTPTGFEIVLVGSGQRIISDGDISYYNSTSNEFGLTAGCLGRIREMELYHQAFEARLDGRFLNNGSFWADLDSMPPPGGLSLLDILAVQRGWSTSLRMEQCYPSGYSPNCTNPTFLEDLLIHFQNIGKLVH